MQFDLLVRQPQYLNQIATWYYQEWGAQTPNYQLQDAIDELTTYLNAQNPTALIAIDGDRVAAVAQLKHHEIPALSDKKHWLGGVYVSADYRGQGLAAKLVRYALEHAQQQGIEQLYLQTSHADGGLYRRLGFLPLAPYQNHGQQVLLMHYPVSRLNTQPATSPA